MDAKIWISGRTCRILIMEGETAIDMNDDWNNIASGEMWVNDYYPRAEQEIIRDRSKIPEMDVQWDRWTLEGGES